MYTLYLDRQGARLGVEGYQLTLQDRTGNVCYFPLEQVDRVMVYGQVQITTAALGALLERGIPTTLLTKRGWLHGHLAPNCGGQVKRRCRQYELMQDPARALPLVRALIKAKLRNQRWLLRVLNMRECAASLARFVRTVPPIANVDYLRGLEGSAARQYFSAFPKLLEDTPFDFPGRRHRPATDPVNAMLSLGYTLLLAELQSAIIGYGLDPFAGVFHASNGSQPACALDLMEPLRCLVDRMVLRLARHTFGQDDFVMDDGGACLLADGKRGRFYQAWETLMQEKVQWEGKQQPYRRIIHGQIGVLARYLDEPANGFRPLVLSSLGR